MLVHGAFADASSWNGVIERLQAKGIPVTAPANPLRGIAADSAYTAAVFEQIEGPVLAVGHSYGGAVITNAATDAKNVVGLVYVAAFAPDEGETLGAVEAGSKDSVLNSALVPRQYPTADGGSATEFSIDPAKARDAFAGDLSDQQAALIAATQRPVAEAAFSEPNGPPAWKHLPVLGRRRHRRQGRRHRRRPLDGRAGRRDDHRGRGLARDHGLPAAGRDRRDPRSRGGGRGRPRSVREMAVHDRPRRRRSARVSQIDAGPLNVGYVDAGPADGPAVVLLHGWPYDIHSYVEVVPLLTAAGYRVIVPYLRGYGTTRFLSDDTLRNGEQAALAARRDRADGRARHRDGGRRRVRLGSANAPTSSPRCGPSAAAASSR